MESLKNIIKETVQTKSKLYENTSKVKDNIRYVVAIGIHNSWGDLDECFGMTEESFRKYIKRLNLHHFVGTKELVSAFEKEWRVEDLTVKDININGIYDIEGDYEDEFGNHNLLL